MSLDYGKVIRILILEQYYLRASALTE